MALTKKVSRQPTKAEPKLQRKKPASKSNLEDDYNRFMKTQEGSEEYRKAGDELMDRVFSGK